MRHLSAGRQAQALPLVRQDSNPVSMSKVYALVCVCALICVLWYVSWPLSSHMCNLLCVLSYVCSSMLSYVCSHICVLICALMCMLSYVSFPLCSDMCALVCVLFHACSHMSAPLCSHLCVTVIVITTTSLVSFSAPAVWRGHVFAVPSCLSRSPDHIPSSRTREI